MTTFSMIVNGTFRGDVVPTDKHVGQRLVVGQRLWRTRLKEYRVEGCVGTGLNTNLNSWHTGCVTGSVDMVHSRWPANWRKFCEFTRRDREPF
mgnify:CR=1 FL=1